MTKKAAKNFQLWMAADDTTTPVVADAVATLRSVAPQLSRPSTDVTASGDAQQDWLAGLAGGTFQVSGVTDLTNNGNLQLIDAMKDGDPRNFQLLPDADDVGDYFEFSAFIESLSPLTGSVDGSFEFTATLRMTVATPFDWVSAV